MNRPLRFSARRTNGGRFFWELIPRNGAMWLHGGVWWGKVGLVRQKVGNCQIERSVIRFCSALETRLRLVMFYNERIFKFDSGQRQRQMDCKRFEAPRNSYYYSSSPLIVFVSFAI